MAARAAILAAVPPASAVRTPFKVSSIAAAPSSAGGKPAPSRRSRQGAKVVAVAEAQRSMNRSFEAALKYRCVSMAPDALVWTCMVAAARVAAVLLLLVGPSPALLCSFLDSESGL